MPVSFACIGCIKDVVALVVDCSRIINLNIGTTEEYPDMQLNDQSLKVVTKYCFKV